MIGGEDDELGEMFQFDLRRVWIKNNWVLTKSKKEVNHEIRKEMKWREIEGKRRKER